MGETQEALDAIITEYAVMMMNAGYEEAANYMLDHEPDGEVYKAALTRQSDYINELEEDRLAVFEEMAKRGEVIRVLNDILVINKRNLETAQEAADRLSEGEFVSSKTQNLRNKPDCVRQTGDKTNDR